MLLADRRMRLIYLCLAGMEAAWITPFWLLIYRPARAPWLAYGTILAGLLAWTLALELLSRTKVESPRFELVALGLMTLTSLLAVRLALYGGRPVYDVRWFGEALAATLNFQGGFPLPLALVLANLFLWQRATHATSRELTFFGVGVSFRLGMLLLIVGAGLLAHLRGQMPAGDHGAGSWLAFSSLLVWLYFGLGLTATAVARIREKAADAQSAGATLPPRRFAQLLLAVGLTVGGAGLLSLVYTPAGFFALFRRLDPLWQLVKVPLVALFLWLARVLEPFFLWLEAQLMLFLEGRGIDVRPQNPLAPLAQKQEALAQAPNPLWTILANVGIGLAIIVAVLIAAAFLVLYLEKVRRGQMHEQAEEEGAEAVTLGGGILSRGIQTLREMAGLVRRFGLSRQLLAAISVQNIYANLCRLARQRGHPRRPAQPPDDYLPVLARAFPGQEEPLGRITAAYMRVHYGERPVSQAELACVRADYQRVRKVPERSGSG
jgi:hypothetical protein